MNSPEPNSLLFLLLKVAAEFAQRELLFFRPGPALGETAVSPRNSQVHEVENPMYFTWKSLDDPTSYMIL